MTKHYHILNGDALKEQFPKSINGEVIIARECLVDGEVQGKNLNDFYKTRSQFISASYQGFEAQDYYEKTVPEFEKIQNVTADSTIHLWFEEDLFCQVNMWFVCYLISEYTGKSKVYLILPNEDTPYNFGAMNEEALELAFTNRIKIKPSELKDLSRLWQLYQKSACKRMLSIAETHIDKFPFLLPAIKAHEERFSINGEFGHLEQSLIEIMKDLKTDEFEEIFKVFSKKENIYGLGDLQVKRILKELKKKQNNG